MRLEHALDSFEAALETERPALASFLRRRVGDAHVDDAVQETFLRAWRQRARFDRRRRLGPWLLTVGAHVAEDLRRREHLRRTDPLQDADDDTASPPALAAVRETKDRLAGALSALEPLAREVFLAFHDRGWSIARIAQEHHLPTGTVKSHLHRTRRRLARSLEESQ